MQYHSSWKKNEKEIFEKCITAHGGWTAWKALTKIEFKLDKFTGGLVFAKGLNRSFFNPTKIVAFPHQQRIDFIYPSHTDTYQGGEVTYSDLKVRIDNGRSIFTGRTLEKWLPEHAAYFFGYAWTNYISYPFILPQFELLDFTVIGENQIFKIKFSEGHRTHCKIQSFYFNKSNLLFRHDYRATLAGPFVYGAHFTHDYQEIYGIQFACTRVVNAKLGGVVTPMNGIYGKMSIC